MMEQGEHAGTGPGQETPRPIPLITSYQAPVRLPEPPQPSPLPVPRPRGPRPGTVVAVVALAFVLATCGVASAGIAAFVAWSEHGPAALESGEDFEDVEGYLEEDVPAETVRKTVKDGARIEGAIATALSADFPGWTVRESELTEERWSRGGRDVWTMRLESGSHAGILLDVVYARDTEDPDAGTGLAPAGWSTTESVFRATARPAVGAELLDLFARDVSARPILVSGRQETARPSDRLGPPYRIDYRGVNGASGGMVVYDRTAGGWRRR